MGSILVDMVENDGALLLPVNQRSFQKAEHVKVLVLVIVITSRVSEKYVACQFPEGHKQEADVHSEVNHPTGNAGSLSSITLGATLLSQISAFG